MKGEKNPKPRWQPYATRILKGLGGCGVGHALGTLLIRMIQRGRVRVWFEMEVNTTIQFTCTTLQYHTSIQASKQPDRYAWLLPTVDQKLNFPCYFAVSSALLVELSQSVLQELFNFLRSRCWRFKSFSLDAFALLLRSSSSMRSSSSRKNMRPSLPSPCEAVFSTLKFLLGGVEQLDSHSLCCNIASSCPSIEFREAVKLDLEWVWAWRT